MEVKILAEIDAKSYFEFVASTIQSTIEISDSEDKELKTGICNRISEYNEQWIAVIHIDKMYNNIIK